MPSTEMFSQLKLYSIGIVAENKKLDSQIVEVTPIEDIPHLDGEIKSGIVQDTVTSDDGKGGQEQIQTTTANSIPATWLPLGNSNRVTAPDVRRGERVVLYRFGDSNEYFWTTLYDDIKLRKLETVIFAWSATKDENAPVSGSNYYFLEISTHKGLVHFHSTKANGEFCAYDIQINTKDGFIQFKDDAGNLLILDSKEKQLAMKNSDDCSLEINKKYMTLAVPETYTLKAKNKIEQIGETIKIDAGKSIDETTKTHNVKASDGLSETVGKYNLDASGTIDAKASGKIHINGTGVLIEKGVALK